jgi:hypothetical protein
LENLQTQIDALTQQLHQERKAHSHTQQALAQTETKLEAQAQLQAQSRVQALNDMDSVTASLDTMSLNSRSVGGSTVLLQGNKDDGKVKGMSRTQPDVHQKAGKSVSSKLPVSAPDTAPGTLGETHSSLSNEVKQEIFKFCTRHSIPTHIQSAQTITDTDIVGVLRQTSKLLAGATKSDGRSNVASADPDAGVSDAATKIRELEKELRLALGAAEGRWAFKFSPCSV